MDAFVDRHLWHAYGAPVTQECVDDLNRSLNTNYFTLRFVREFVESHISPAFEELGDPWDEGHPLRPLYTLAQEDGYEHIKRVYEEIRKDDSELKQCIGVEEDTLNEEDVFDDSDGGAVKHCFDTDDTGVRRDVELGRDCTATDGPSVSAKVESGARVCLIEDQLGTEFSYVHKQDPTSLMTYFF